MEDNPLTNGPVKFHHIKSNLFRVVHADGFLGGPTPNGHFQLAFYSERAPIPQMTVHEVTDGRLGKELEEERVQRSGIIREIESNVIMDLELAKGLHTWLGERINQTEKLQADLKSKLDKLQ